MKESGAVRPRRMIVGAARGALVGLALWLFGVVMAAEQIEAPREVWVAVMMAVFGASFGCLIGGFVGPTGSRTIAGAAIVGNVVWVVCDGFFHMKGQRYGAFYGVPLGAFLGLLHGLHVESETRSKTAAGHATAGVWDREQDG